MKRYTSFSDRDSIRSPLDALVNSRFRYLKSIERQSGFPHQLKVLGSVLISTSYSYVKRIGLVSTYELGPVSRAKICS